MTIFKKLLKPFTYVQEKYLLTIGLIFGIFGVVLQLFTHSRTISILKMAAIGHQPYLWQTVLDYVLSTLVMALVLWGWGKFINRGTRVVDVLNTVLIARIPLVLLCVSDFNGKLTQISNDVIQVVASGDPTTLNNGDVTYLTIIGIGSVGSLIVFGYYLYQGFKTATNVKKPLHILGFVVLVFITDGLTRLITTLY